MNDELEEFRRFEKEGWDRVAPKYESAWSSLTRLFIERLLDAADLRAGMRLLDVACGPGYVAEAARQRGALPTGLDVAQGMIAIARRERPGIEFHEGEAEKLPFGDGVFDRVVTNFGVLHMTDPIRALAEARRVLAPGGIVGFTVWSRDEISPGAAAIFLSIEEHADRSVHVPQGPPRDLLADEARCRQALSEAGFEGATVNYTTVFGDWIVPSARFCFEAERDAGVRTAALLKGQTPPTLATILATMEKRIERFRRGSEFALPMAAHIVTARRP